MSVFGALGFPVEYGREQPSQRPSPTVIRNIHPDGMGHPSSVLSLLHQPDGATLRDSNGSDPAQDSVRLDSTATRSAECGPTTAVRASPSMVRRTIFVRTSASSRLRNIQPSLWVVRNRHLTYGRHRVMSITEQFTWNFATQPPPALLRHTIKAGRRVTG